MFSHNISLRVLGIAAATALSVVLGSASSSAGEATPTGTVEKLNEALISVMQQSHSLGFTGRAEALEPVIHDAFQLTGMLAAAIGGAEPWNALTDDQRRELSHAFADMSVATYASRFDGYSGEQMTVAGERALPSDRVMVRTVLTSGTNDPINLDYVLTQTDRGWQIVDVMLDGRVSELSRQRSEYGAVIQSEGVDGLIARLQTLTAHMQAGS